MNGGFLHYADIKKFLKNLLRNCRSDFEIILQESGFDISGHPDCPIRAVIAMGKLPSAFVSPLGKKNLWSIIVNSGLLQIPVSLRSDKQMDIKLFSEFLRKNDPSKNMAFMEDSFFLLRYKVKSLKAF